MGTWDDGLLDNDSALDGLGDLSHRIVEDIVEASTVERLAAAVGVLLQLSRYEFGLDTPNGPKIVAAVKRHAAGLAKLAPAAREVLQRVMDGDGKDLAERPAAMDPAHATLLNRKSKQGRFGQREAALLESEAAREYVQEIAGRCVEAIDSDFQDEDTWSDLCREAMGIGLLGVLMVIEPCRIERAKLDEWRQKARVGLDTLEEREDEELEFHRRYHGNLDQVFAVLIERFTANAR